MMYCAGQMPVTSKEHYMYKYISINPKLAPLATVLDDAHQAAVAHETALALSAPDLLAHLSTMTFIVETVAHMRGLEDELLPLGNIEPPKPVGKRSPPRRPVGTNFKLATPLIVDIKPGEVRVIPWATLRALFPGDTREQMRGAVQSAAIKLWSRGNNSTCAFKDHGLEIMNTTLV